MQFQWLPATCGLILFLLVWQLFVVVTGLPPILLPPPTQVAMALWQERLVLCRAVTATFAASMLGLCLSLASGSILAVVFAQSRWLRSAFIPYIVFLQTVPVVAIAPLLITWFGYRFHTVVLVSAIVSLFPVVSNATTGLISVDPLLVDLFRIHGASRWQILIKLRIPNAVRYLVLGLRVSAGLAVIGAIVGELFVGDVISRFAGLGTIINAWQRMVRTDAVIAAIGASTFLGMAVLSIVNLVSTRLLHRWTDSADFEAQG
ncbi:MAG: ABC transporter permease subunit [Planctomycetota bacterium]|nr:MAG: ABC transporter permease subunit [Planctomycetota bacterium]